MSNEVIASLPQESTDLSLHVQLCEQRYIQLITKLDHVDARFEKIEVMLIEIKDSVKGVEQKNTSRYLKWAGAVIGVLSTTLIGLVVHTVFK
jgi:hypothetical protein